MQIEEIKVTLKEKHSSNEKLDEILDKLVKAEDSSDFIDLAE